MLIFSENDNYLKSYIPTMISLNVSFEKVLSTNHRVTVSKTAYLAGKIRSNIQMQNVQTGIHSNLYQNSFMGGLI